MVLVYHIFHIRHSRAIAIDIGRILEHLELSGPHVVLMKFHVIASHMAVFQTTYIPRSYLAIARIIRNPLTFHHINWLFNRSSTMVYYNPHITGYW